MSRILQYADLSGLVRSCIFPFAVWILSTSKRITRRRQQGHELLFKTFFRVHVMLTRTVLYHLSLGGGGWSGLFVEFEPEVPHRRFVVGRAICAGHLYVRDTHTDKHTGRTL